MNPHYHPYGGPELTSPHPPSPDNNNYPGHPGPGAPHGHPHMHPTNGHGIGPLGFLIKGHPGGPHDQFPHPHHQHPAFSSAGPPPGAPQQHPHGLNNNNNNNNNIKICGGCGGKIVERYLLHALDRFWHNSCLKCSCCGAMLADLGTSCYTKSGMILCKHDYTRMFGSGICSACGQVIASNELVMRSGPSQQQPGSHVFHIKCFTCSKCSNNLVPGDRYYMLAGSLVCEQDWHKLVKSSAAAPTVRKGKVGRPRRSRD